MRQTAQLTRRRLLALCACDAAEQETLVRLERAAAAFRQTADDADWNLLLHEVEREGMAPLLHKHLGAVGWGGAAPCKACGCGAVTPAASAAGPPPRSSAPARRRA
ncbi:MAG: hypothetical protein ACTFAL_12110 [Candidatus Electronema sp. V4]|uniref:hypothetical protein n=1 Tax=Candidatus Electronema sp. V4 TaxID=3454756 RepID=UPI0040558286